MQGFTFQRFKKLNKINKLNPLFTYSNTQIWDPNRTQTQNAERERERERDLVERGKGYFWYFANGAGPRGLCLF